ncbi:MAG: Gfo/Idh/MocA family oxidoreductase [Clostridia bacterium]|nr:Gfo/Idh/MocA family oxidoreductase [Clostridia bacterium]
MKKIKIAQIGTSLYSHGQLIWETITAQPDLFEIAGYALPENEAEKFPRKMPAFEGFRQLMVEEILTDPTIEAVTIETEEIYLTKYALMAAKAGKHIHMEKPGGLNSADFEALIAAMKKSGKVLHLGYMYRYNPYVQELLAKVRSGELGEIINVEAQMNMMFPLTDEARQWLKTFPGGMTFFLGCHLIDLILQIQGTPQEILPLNCATHIGGTTSEDFGMAAFKYPNGVSFAKTNAAEVGGYNRRQLVVCGSKGTVELKPLEINEGRSCVSTARAEYPSGAHSQSAPFNRYGGMMAAFAAYARGEKENPYTLDYELTLYQTILKACGAIK